MVLQVAGAAWAHAIHSKKIMFNILRRSIKLRLLFNTIIRFKLLNFAVMTIEQIKDMRDRILVLGRFL